MIPTESSLYPPLSDIEIQFLFNAFTLSIMKIRADAESYKKPNSLHSFNFHYNRLCEIIAVYGDLRTNLGDFINRLNDIVYQKSFNPFQNTPNELFASAMSSEPIINLLASRADQNQTLTQLFANQQTATK